MSQTSSGPNSVRFERDDASTGSSRPGHPRWVRTCHWLIAVSVLTLAFSGFVILMAHPRLYWGSEVGNDLTPALLELPISRNYRHGGWTRGEPFFAVANSPVTANRTYEIFNQNGWGRSLHFLAAWFLAFSGIVYLAGGLVGGHFRRHLLPRTGERSLRLLWQDLVDHLRMRFRPAPGGPPYGLLQKTTYRCSCASNSDHLCSLKFDQSERRVAQAVACG